MTARNALCPCGSGKKYKRCCLMLSSAIRSSELLNSGEEALRISILDIALRTLEDIKQNPINKGKKYDFKDFKVLLGLSVCLWNISFLASSRVSEILSYIESEHSRSRLQRITSWSRSLNTVTKLMILEAIPKEDSGNYSMEIITSTPDKLMIEENLSSILGDILDAVDFMLENGGKK